MKGPACAYMPGLSVLSLMRLSRRLAMRPSRLFDIGVEGCSGGADKEASPLAQPYDAVSDIKDAITFQHSEPGVAAEQHLRIEPVRGGKGGNIDAEVAHQPLDDACPQSILGRHPVAFHRCKPTEAMCWA